MVRSDESPLEQQRLRSRKRVNNSVYYPMILLAMAVLLLALSRYAEQAISASPNAASVLLFTICLGCAAILVLLALWSLAIEIWSDIKKFRAGRRVTARRER